MQRDGPDDEATAAPACGTCVVDRIRNVLDSGFDVRTPVRGKVLINRLAEVEPGTATIGVTAGLSVVTFRDATGPAWF